MFVLTSFASFKISPLEGNDRTCMLVTLFLCNVQMSLYITDEGPNAESTTAIDSFVNASTIFIFLAIVEYLIILKRLSKYRNNREGIKYEKALKFSQKLDYYASILFPIFYIFYVKVHLSFHLLHTDCNSLKKRKVKFRPTFWETLQCPNEIFLKLHDVMNHIEDLKYQRTRNPTKIKKAKTQPEGRKTDNASPGLYFSK